MELCCARLVDAPWTDRPSRLESALASLSGDGGLTQPPSARKVVAVRGTTAAQAARPDGCITKRRPDAAAIRRRRTVEVAWAPSGEPRSRDGRRGGTHLGRPRTSPLGRRGGGATTVTVPGLAGPVGQESSRYDPRPVARRGAKTHPQHEDFSWTIAVVDHPPRTDSQAYRASRLLMLAIVGRVERVR